MMDKSEFDELTGRNHPTASADDIIALVNSIVDAVLKNEAGLTADGVRRGVAERITGFLGQQFSSPSVTPTATKFSVRRPTKPGWYWVKLPVNYGAPSIRVVHVTEYMAGLMAEGVGNVLAISGAKWFGPIEVPK